MTSNLEPDKLGDTLYFYFIFGLIRFKRVESFKISHSTGFNTKVVTITILRDYVRKERRFYVYLCSLFVFLIFDLMYWCLRFLFNRWKTVLDPRTGGRSSGYLERTLLTDHQMFVRRETLVVGTIRLSPLYSPPGFWRGSKLLSDPSEFSESYINISLHTRYCCFAMVRVSRFSFPGTPLRSPFRPCPKVLKSGSPLCDPYKLKASLFSSVVHTLRRLVPSNNLSYWFRK